MIAKPWCQLLLVHLLLCAGAIVEGQTTPAALVNDNRTGGGVLRNGVLAIHLEARSAVWFPEKDGGPHLTVSAFAEEGLAPQIPGPLIRVPAETEVFAAIRNRLDHAIFVHGLGSHTAAVPTPPAVPEANVDVDPNALEIGAGAVREVHFNVGSPGTYYYWGCDDRLSPGLRAGADSMLLGAFIVDPPDVHPDDRVFVIGTWLPKGNTPFDTLPSINGKSWPYTEHLNLHVGEPVRWRWINTSDADHAMHMHGFYFQVDGVGDQDHFATYKPAERPIVVTQEMPLGGTFNMTWTPERPGHWIMHCHSSIHMMIGNVAEYPVSADYSPENAGMGGVILGVNVEPAGKSTSAATTASADVHKYRLLVRYRLGTARTFAGYSFDLVKAGRETPPDELAPVGDPLLLTRGEPAEIEVVNQLKEPTTVHWHGLELESAGTFIYHSHWQERKQLGAGLTGPLIVLPPGEKFDPGTDKTFLFTRDGTDGPEPLLLNGVPQPAPIPLTVGTRYRFRFINITPVDSDLTYSIADASGALAQWRAIAKDGWDLSADRTTLKPAREDYLSVGETRDYYFTPAKAGEFYLRAIAFPRMWVSQTFIAAPPAK